jgi:hypothetical protein
LMMMIMSKLKMWLANTWADLVGPASRIISVKLKPLVRLCLCAGRSSGCGQHLTDRSIDGG